MLVVLALMDATNSMDAYITYLRNNGKFEMFQTQTANYLEIPDDKDEVDINRGSSASVKS